MKSKNGWGLSEMLILCCILIGFLLLAIVLANQLYNGVGKMNEEAIKNVGYSYEAIEQNLLKASQRYYKKHKSSTILSSDLIEEGFLSKQELTPKNQITPCIGYTTVTDTKFTPYISCEDYETIGY